MREDLNAFGNELNYYNVACEYLSEIHKKTLTLDNTACEYPENIPG
jgi:hypothetical protein